MLVQEMHIDFDVKLQKINSNSIDTFLPQEKDWLLNLAQYRDIRKHGVRVLNRKKEGGEDSFARYAEFERLIKRVTLPAVVATDGQYVYSVLPYDFFDYRNGKTKSYYNCDDIVTTKDDISEYIITVPFLNKVVVTAEKFVDFEIKIKRGIVTTSIFIASDYNFNDGNPFTSFEEKFVLVNHVLEVLNRRSDIEVRWETYKDLYDVHHFQFITSDPTITNIDIYYDGSGTLPAPVEHVFQSYSEVPNVIVKDPVALRLVETEELYDVLNHPYAKTIYDSPVTTLRDGAIQVYHDDKFVVNTISLDYIKKPRLISLYLNQSCEIAESRHDVIVDTAVQLASAYTGSDVHKLIINENLLNE